MFLFENLTIYNESIEFVLYIRKLINTFPEFERYSLSDQLRRASLLIPLNIAESSGRTVKEVYRYMMIARGSCYECVACIEVAYRSGYLSKESHLISRDYLDKLIRMITRYKQQL